MAVCNALTLQAAPPGRVQTTARPGWVKPIALDEPSAIQADSASDGFLYLLKDYQVHAEKQTSYFHYVRKIYSQTGVQNGSEIEVTYDPSYQQLFFHEVKIRREGREINQLDPARFKIMQREKGKDSFIYDESLTALLLLEDVREGDYIEYAYSIVGRNPVYNNQFFTYFYLQGYDPADRTCTRIVAAASRPLHITYQNTQTKPVLTREGAWQVYEWDQKNVPGLAMDSDVPAWYDPYPCIWISEYESWEAVKGWANTLFKVNVATSPLLSAKVREITTSTPAPEKRLEAAIHFVQNEIRYTGLEAGISGYKPHQPEQIMRQRFGDCKDKSLLLATMLTQMNIEANPALVNTSYRQELTSWGPTPYAFNHCIVKVKFGGKDYWYDPTISSQGGTYQRMYCPNYRKALVIDGAATGLEDLPLSLNSRIAVKEVFRVDSIGGKTIYQVETKYLGYEADYQREYFANHAQREIEKDYLNYYAKTYPGIRTKRALVSEDDAVENIFTTREEYEIEDFFYEPDTTKLLALECTTFPHTMRDRITLPTGRIRTMPIGLAFPSEYEYETIIRLPEAWNITDATQTISDDHVFFRREVRYDSNTVTIRYAYKVLKDHVPAGLAAAYIKKQNQIRDLLGYGLTYTRDEAAKSDLFRLNSWMLLLAGIVWLAAVYLAIKVYYYDQEPITVSAPGEKIDGWLILFGIGLFIRPLTIFFALISNNYFDLAVWQGLTDAKLESYNPALAAFIVGEMSVNLVAWAISVLLIVLFLQRRSSFPRVVTIYLAGYLIFSLLDCALVSSIAPKADLSATYKEVGFTLIGTMIWVPYFNISKRVKRTFVRTLTT